MAPKKATSSSNPETRPSPDKNAMRHVEEALRNLRFGQVTIVVQDGVVVLIERTEKIRITT